MIHLYTGDGKGKTTAAAGLAVRAAGNGMKVIFAQFMKGNDTGEIVSLNQLENITVVRCDKNYGFFRNMSEDEKHQLTECHNKMLDEILAVTDAGEVNMIVLDEITHAMKYNLVDEGKIIKLLEFSDLELVITGREPKDRIIEKADYITEMTKIKHPFERGIKARKGIEF